MDYAPEPTARQLAALSQKTAARIDYDHRIHGGLGCTMDVLRLDGPSPSRVVLRRYGPWWERRGVDVARREFIVLELLAQNGVPAPEPLWLGRGDIFSEPAILISYVEAQPEMTPEDPIAWADELAATLARIHACRVTEAARSVLGSGPPESMETEPPPGFHDHPLASRLLRHLQELRAEIDFDEAVLLHADFWPGNILWKEGEVVAVVDWENAALGDRASDVAYCALDMRYLGLDEASSHFVAAYRRLTGRRLDTFDFWTASALIRPMPDIAEWLPAWTQLGYAAADADSLRSRHAQLVEEVLSA